MKRLLFTLGISAVIFMGCSGGKSSIEGYWLNLANARVEKNHYAWRVRIEKNDKGDLIYVKYYDEPDEKVPMTYVKERDYYSLFTGGGRVHLKYLTEKDHLIITDPQDVGDLFPMEFERMNADSLAAYKKSKGL